LFAFGGSGGVVVHRELLVVLLKILPIPLKKSKFLAIIPKNFLFMPPE
jgi:hypothetical protein